MSRVLFHLDRPSVSIVVRNHKTTRAPIQLCYLRSGIAYNPFHTDIESQRLIRTCLDLPGAPAAGDGRGAQLVEQDGLADPAQPGEDQ